MHDETLEEMWRVKAALSAPNDSWETYAAALFAFQEEERKRGVRIVSLPPKRPDHLEPDPSLSVAEGSPPTTVPHPPKVDIPLPFSHNSVPARRPWRTHGEPR